MYANTWVFISLYTASRLVVIVISPSSALKVVTEFIILSNSSPASKVMFKLFRLERFIYRPSILPCSSCTAWVVKSPTMSKLLIAVVSPLASAPITCTNEVKASLAPSTEVIVVAPTFAKSIRAPSILAAETWKPSKGPLVAVKISKPLTTKVDNRLFLNWLNTPLVP